jgi:integrase
MNETKKNPQGVFEKVTGSGIYWIRYTMASGKRRSERIGSKAAAMRMYQLRKSQVWEGKKLPASVRMQRAVLFSELVEDMLSYSKTHKKSWDDDRHRSGKLLEKFKDEVAENITPQQFEKFLDERQIKPATRNRYRALLKLMYRLAEESRKITTNPARLLRMKKEDNGRVRFLSTEEETKLRAAIPADRRVELDIALNCGLRLSEQYRTEWRHVDFENRILSVEDTKTSDTRHIPLNDAALAAFRALEKKKTGNSVFLRVPGHGADSRTGVKSPREWFDDAVEKAKLEKITWHALRHTFASRLVMSAVDIRTVAELMGHKTIQMTMRYSHLAPQHKLDAVLKLGAYVPTEKKNVVTFPRRHREMRRKPVATRMATGANRGLRKTATK